MEKRRAKIMARSENDQNMIYFKALQLNRREGYPWKQSIAIALRMYKDGELKSTSTQIKQQQKQQQKPAEPIQKGIETKSKKNQSSRNALISLIIQQAVKAIGNNKERFIQAVATITLQPIEIIQQKYTEGEDRWKVFHTPGVTIEQAARDNVYNYIMNG